MRNAFTYCIMIIPFFELSCATNSTKEKIFRDIAIGAAIGGIAGQVSSDNKEAYSIMFAGIGAASAGVLSTFLNVNDDENVKKENEQLKTQIKNFEKQLKPQLIQQGNSLFNSPIPSEVSSLVEPGEWKRYKLDQWVQDPNQVNTWYRQVEMFEIIPPVAK